MKLSHNIFTCKEKVACPLFTCVSESGMTAIAFAFAKDHDIVLISSLFGSDFITQKNSEIATIIIISLLITYLTIKRLKRGVETGLNILQLQNLFTCKK